MKFLKETAPLKMGLRSPMSRSNSATARWYLHDKLCHNVPTYQPGQCTNGRGSSMSSPEP